MDSLPKQRRQTVQTPQRFDPSMHQVRPANNGTTNEIVSTKRDRISKFELDGIYAVERRENTTSFTKPAEHNLWQRRRRRTEPRPQSTCTKIWRVGLVEGGCIDGVEIVEARGTFWVNVGHPIIINEDFVA